MSDHNQSKKFKNLGKNSKIIHFKFKEINKEMIKLVEKQQNYSSCRLNI